jgi:hypothetical protein
LEYVGLALWGPDAVEHEICGMGCLVLVDGAWKRKADERVAAKLTWHDVVRSAVFDVLLENTTAIRLC